MGFIVRCNIKSLQSNDYRTVGQMLATMIVQGGERPCFLSQSVCDYICVGLDARNPEIEEIPDYTIKNDLKKVTVVNSVHKIDVIIEVHRNYLQFFSVSVFILKY